MSEKFSIDEFLAAKLSDAASEIDAAAVSSEEFKLFAQTLRGLVGELRGAMTELVEAGQLANTLSMLSGAAGADATLEKEAAAPAAKVPGPISTGRSNSGGASRAGTSTGVGKGGGAAQSPPAEPDEERKEKASNAQVAAGLGRMGQAFATRAGTIGKDADDVLRLRNNAHAAAGAFQAMGTLADEAFSAIGQAVGKALNDFATYSKAQEQIKQAHKETAEEAAAATAAQVQAVLGGIAQQAGVKAIFETAEGIAAAATYQYPSAIQHFAAAAVFGSIAAGSAVAGHVIGETRGNTREENEQLAAARGDSGGSSGSSGESGSSGPAVINIYTGQQVFATRAELERDLDRGVREAQRRK